jgi:hypothetical protein
MTSNSANSAVGGSNPLGEALSLLEEVLALLGLPLSFGKASNRPESTSTDFVSDFGPGFLVSREGHRELRRVLAHLHYAVLELLDDKSAFITLFQKGHQN